MTATALAYKWVPGCRLKGNAQEVGEFLEALRTSSGLTADTVLAAARPADSLIHPYFEWDDTIAAEKHRREQAGQLIRSITVKVSEQEPTEQVRAWAAIGSKEARYVNTIEAMSQPDLRRQLLEAALKELAVFQAKYQHLYELSELFVAAESVRQRTRKKAA